MLEKRISTEVNVKKNWDLLSDVNVDIQMGFRE